MYCHLILDLSQEFTNELTGKLIYARVFLESAYTKQIKVIMEFRAVLLIAFRSALLLVTYHNNSK